MHAYPPPPGWPPMSRPVPRVVHWVECRHNIEVEVYPAAAEVYFRDERFVDPVNTQFRFRATVLNARTAHVGWSLRGAAGGPAAGSIDPTGLYRAPAKDGWAHGTTDIVIAAASEDPLRSACAFVTLVGDGPLPPPMPRLQILPHGVELYYHTYNGVPPDGVRVNNGYIAESNKRQLFTALLHDAPSPTLEWRVDGSLRQTDASPHYLFDPGALGIDSGADGREFRIEARLSSRPEVRSTARVQVFNYAWPHEDED